MEQSENEPQEEEHGLYIEEHLFNLKQSAKKAEDSVVDALNRLKLTQHKLKIEMEQLSETELRTRPNLRAWLKSRDLHPDCSFQEFFQKFLEEHKQEYRLDLTDRSILLNKDACKLFGLTGTNVKMRMPEILERLPLLFH